MTTIIDRPPAEARSHQATEAPRNLMSPRPVHGPSTEPVPKSIAAGLLVAWVLGVAWIFAISPEPDPNVPISTLDVVVSLALYGSWGAILSGLARRRQFGMTAGVVGGIMLSGAGFLCLATGHTGAWIAAQIVTGAVLAGLSGAASRIS